MDDELNERPDVPEMLVGLNPDPAEVREDARKAADEAAGEDVRDKIRDVVDVPIDDILRDAIQRHDDEAAAADVQDPEQALDDTDAKFSKAVDDVPIDDMANDATPESPRDDGMDVGDASRAAGSSPIRPASPRPSHMGVDPKAIRQARHARAEAAKFGFSAPRRTAGQKDAWLQWYRMSQGMSPEDVPVDDMLRPSAPSDQPGSVAAEPSRPSTPDEEKFWWDEHMRDSSSVPIDDMVRPGSHVPVSQSTDRANNIDVLVPQGNDKELDDQVIEMLRRLLEQKRSFRHKLLNVLEEQWQMLVADHSRLEVIEAAFERGRESY